MAKIIPEQLKTRELLRPSGDTGRYFVLTEYLFDRIYKKNEQGDIQNQSSIFNRNLIILEQFLIADELAAEDEADITSDIEDTHKSALKKVTRLIPSSRNFRYADFSKTRLPKADFFGASKELSDFSHANLSGTMLSNVRMNTLSFRTQIRVIPNFRMQNGLMPNFKAQNLQRLSSH